MRTTSTAAGQAPAVRDPDIRIALVESLAERLTGRPHLVEHEVDVRWHVPARIDLLTVTDRITGFEIKSDVDSLTRLPRQVAAYAYVLERAYLVVGTRHREHATELIPPWWGIVTAQRDARGALELREVRPGALNPQISPLAATTFMSRRDLVRALTALGERGPSACGVDALRTMLVERAGAERTVDLVRAALLARPGATT